RLSRAGASACDKFSSPPLTRRSVGARQVFFPASHEPERRRATSFLPRPSRGEASACDKFSSPPLTSGSGGVRQVFFRAPHGAKRRRAARFSSPPLTRRGVGAADGAVW